MTLNNLCLFLQKWQLVKHKINMDIEVTMNNMLKCSTLEIYDYYYQAVNEMKEDIKGNRVDLVIKDFNGAIRFIKNEGLTFEI